MFVFTLFRDCVYYIILYYTIQWQYMIFTLRGGWMEWNGQKKSKFSGHWIWITGYLSYKFRGCHIEAGEKNKTCRAFSVASCNLCCLLLFPPIVYMPRWLKTLELCAFTTRIFDFLPRDDIIIMRVTKKKMIIIIIVRLIVLWKKSWHFNFLSLVWCGAAR